MGTKSKMGWNSRCTHRLPVGVDDLYTAIRARVRPRQQVPRITRQWAKAILRRHTKWVRKHKTRDQWSDMDCLAMVLSRKIL